MIHYKGQVPIDNLMAGASFFGVGEKENRMLYTIRFVQYPFGFTITRIIQSYPIRSGYFFLFLSSFPPSGLARMERHKAPSPQGKGLHPRGRDAPANRRGAFLACAPGFQAALSPVMAALRSSHRKRSYAGRCPATAHRAVPLPPMIHYTCGGAFILSMPGSIFLLVG